MCIITLGVRTAVCLLVMGMLCNYGVCTWPCGARAPIGVITMHYFSQTNGHDPRHPRGIPYTGSRSKKIMRRTAIVVIVVVAGLRGMVT